MAQGFPTGSGAICGSEQEIPRNAEKTREVRLTAEEVTSRPSQAKTGLCVSPRKPPGSPLRAKACHSPATPRIAVLIWRLPAQLNWETMKPMLQPGQNVRVNLAGVQVGSVIFHAAVTDAVGTVLRQTSENPPKYLIKLLFSFRGVDEVEVSEGRIVAKS